MSSKHTVKTETIEIENLNLSTPTIYNGINEALNNRTLSSRQQNICAISTDYTYKISSYSSDPYSYSRHLNKPLPELPQNKVIQLTVNTSINEEDMTMDPEISDNEEKKNDTNRIQCICNIQCIKRFICNRYIKTRCILLICNILLIFICFILGMGQIYNMKLNDEWYIDDDLNVNKDVLFSNNKRAFMDIISIDNESQIFWSIIFCVFLLWFLFCFVYFVWILMMDLINYIYGIYDVYDDDIDYYLKKDYNHNHCKRIYPYCLCCFWCIEKNTFCMDLCGGYWRLLIQYHFFCGLDVAIYILSLIMKNLITISIQIIALLQYNEHMLFLIVYGLIIGIHQIIIGILWYFYVFKHNQCNGRYFNLFIYSVDYIFYIGYLINPILYQYINYNGLYSALFSMQFTLIQYLSIIIPLIFLSFNTYFASLYFIRKTHESWKYETFINPNINDERKDVLTPRNTQSLSESELYIFQEKRIRDSFNDSCCCMVFFNGKLFLDGNLEFLWLIERRESIHKYDHTQMIIINYHKKQQLLRRLLLLFIAFIIIIFGIFVPVFIIIHFMNAINICSETQDIIWNNYCQFKVYPFTHSHESYQCQCRVLRIYHHHHHHHDDNININRIWNDFVMLEAVQIDIDSNLSLNHMVYSDILRVIDFNHIHINIVDINDRLPNLEYLRLHNGQIDELSISGINSIQYLDVAGNDIDDINWICSDTFSDKLKYLILSNNPINNISYCMYNLLSMPNLLELNIFGTDIDINSFPENKEIFYNENTVYYLQNNPICHKFENSPQQIRDYSDSLYSFLINSNGCINNNYCNFSNESDLNNLCIPKLWQNDICDKECNLEICSFDHGKCQ